MKIIRVPEKYCIEESPVMGGCYINISIEAMRCLIADAKKFNAMLANAVEVYNYYKEDTWSQSPEENGTDAYRALIINIEPIVRQTREDKMAEVLSAFVRLHSDVPNLPENKIQLDLIETTKALLEGEK